MYYEWNAAKARRRNAVKFLCTCLAAIAVCALPFWWLVKEASF